MKKIYKITTGVVSCSTRKAGELSVVHKLSIFAVIIAALTFTFCEDIMEQVKEYNEMFKVLSVEPANNASNVPYTTVITATFSNDVDMSTVSSSTFKVNNGAVTGNFSYDPVSRGVTFTPASEFLHSSVYSVNITQGIFSIEGKPLESAYSGSFTTEVYHFNVVSVSPSAGGVDVPVSSNIIVQFDDNIDDTTLAAAILLNGASPGLNLPVGYDALTKTATYDLSSDLSSSSAYTVTLTTDVKNITGDSMASDYSWSFTTAAVSLSEIYVLTPLGVDMLSGNTFDFGNQVNPGTRSAVFTIGNSGTTNLDLTGLPLSITGVNSDQFSISTQPVTPVGAGGTTNVTVVFSPSGLAGTKNAVLSIANNDSNENPFIINLTGLALSTGAPEIQITDSGVILIDDDYMAEFGTVSVGGTGTKTFVIHNIGSAALTISSVTFGWFNPALFTTNLTPQSIAAGGTLPFEVYFKPVTPVNAKATITINNDDSDEGSYVIRLKGRGI
jgi:hypothetical protein